MYFRNSNNFNYNNISGSLFLYRKSKLPKVQNLINKANNMKSIETELV